jgi:hypothetical protein
MSPSLGGRRKASPIKVVTEIMTSTQADDNQA